MILVSGDIGLCGYSRGVPWKWGQTAVGLSKMAIFNNSLTISSEALEQLEVRPTLLYTLCPNKKWPPKQIAIIR